MNTDNFFTQQLILQDDWVRLEPLQEEHFDALWPIAQHKELWQFTGAKISTQQDFRRYFDAALKEKQNKKAYPFAYFNKISNQYVGSTRYGNIDFANKKLEIGWTWIHPQLQGTGFNKHAKYLLLRYAFAQLHLNRVELKTSHLNLKSQKAMLNIGAVKEGTLRRHIINDDGVVRDTIYFSFIAEEWPTIKQTFFGDFPG